MNKIRREVYSGKIRKCASTNFCLIDELFWYKNQEVLLCKIHNKSSNYTPNTNPPVTSLRQSKNWSGASRKATSLRLCLVLQVPVRPSLWRMSLPGSTNQLWYLPTIKHWQHSFTARWRNSSLRTQWNILSPSMRKSQNRWYFVVCGWLNIQMLWKR